jgi:RNA polymerase sigma factor (sigma-70 family)
MLGSGLNTVAEGLRAVFERSVAGLPDGQLLGRFIATRDEAAFEAIVARHGRMVLSVCQSLLGGRHDAEDAFQATFMVLARRAPTIRDPELLGPWLYGVARRTARKAQVRAARRRRHEEKAAMSATQSRQESAPGALGADEACALYEEIGRLPDRYRAAVVLCYLQGQSHAKAGRRLRKPEGTISARLSRARAIRDFSPIPTVNHAAHDDRWPT